MNSKMLSAFGDELEKIALWGAFKNLVREGWHGPAHSRQGMLGKGLMIAGTVPMVQQALSAEDQTGLERSRPERVAGLVGNVTGGLMGSALGMRAVAPKILADGTKTLGWKGSLMGLGGAMLGSHIGQKITSAPFHRHPQPQPQVAQPVNGVPA